MFRRGETLWVDSLAQVLLAAMPATLFFLLFFACFSSLPSRPAIAVRIGVLIDPSSSVGGEQRAAIEIAAADFRSSVSDGLFLNISDSLGQAEALISDWGANAIISGGSWPETVQISKISAKTRDVPLLTLAPQPPTAAAKPYLFPLSSPSPASYIRCLAHLIRLYNWRQVIVIYEDDDYAAAASSIIPPLNNALRAAGSEIVDHVVISSSNSVRRELENLAKQLCKVYVIVRWSSPSVAIDLFKHAQDLGMMGEGHVWIAGDDITSLVDSSFTPAFVSSFMQGLIGIMADFNETSQSYGDFRAKFQKRGKASSEPGMPALRAYDAVHVIALARAGGDLQKAIQSTNFTGLSGQVEFGSEKDSSAFRVVNVVGKSYRVMGIWSAGAGFDRGVKEMRRGVYWPGGVAGRVPGGWGKLRIGVPAKAVFDDFVKVERGGNGEVENVTGFCIEVFKEACQTLDYEIDYEFIPFNRTYDELVAAVPEVFDGVVGDVTILAKRWDNVSFTEPYLASGLATFVRVKPDHTRWVLTKPFTRAVWFLLAATYAFNCMTVLYLERKHNPEFHGPWNAQLGASAWLIFSAMFFAHGRLHSYYTKAVVGVWLFVLLVLTSAFTASLGSILLTQKLEPVVIDRKIGCNADSFAVEYLQEILGYKSEQIERVPSVENYTAAFESGRITKGYLETPYLRVFLAQHDGYTVYGDIQRLGGFGFVFPKASPLASDMSKAILQLIEDGSLNRLEDKWFSLSMNTCPATAKDRIRESLGLDSLWALFLISIAASTVVLLFFKARRVTGYSLRAVSLSVRERCDSLWKHKLSTRTTLQLSRRPSSSTPQVAPEPADGPAGPAGFAGDIQQTATCQTSTTSN